jgi:NTP pyrophosphatase (non-canonical NTP hydrolase)
MDAKKYLELSDRTCKHIGEEGVTITPEMYDLLHAAFGISGEAGEILDAVKKSFIYNKPLDKENMKEEIGDCLWYIALACRTLNVSFEEIMKSNIDKLTKRYPEKYTDAHAIARADKLE